MSDIAIKIENLSKQYRLGVVGTGTLSHDINRWWARIRGKEDPSLKIGQENTLAETGGDYVWALKDIDLEIKKGEVLGIIGRNGAGKSTLLKILSRVTGPTTGKIKVNGRLASLLEVGTGFHPELTGKENIFLNGAILGMTKNNINKKLDEIVEFAGVAKYLDTPVKRYSSGMYVRLAFAVAAHLEPDILVVDEVLAVGDAEFQKKAIGKMQDVSKGGGRTVLFVSHNMGSVRRLCNNGIILNNGTLEAIGSIEKIVDKYIKGSTKKTSRIVSWENNKKKPISITGLRVKADNKTEEHLLDINDNIKIIIDYTVNEDIKGTNLSFALSKDGIVLLRSWDIDSNKKLFTIRKAGKYTAEFYLPNFLQPGTYSITVSAGQAGIAGFEKKEDGLVFEIDNITIDGTKQSFTRGGIIRSNIVWENYMLS